MTAADPDGHSRRIAAAFDLAAAGYDAPALRYFAFAADRLALRLAPAPGDKVLDIGAGTGAATLALAQAVGSTGRVTAIDLSEAMLARLERKLQQFGIANVDVHVMDGTRLDFRRDYFHHVVASFALFLMPDMEAALSEWRRVLRPGGQLMVSSFRAGSFEPMKTLLLRRLEATVGRALERPPRLTEPQECRALLERAGYEQVQATAEPLGYHLRDPGEWWEIVCSSGLRAALMELPAEKLEPFRAAHLAEVQAGAGPEGLWLDAGIILAGGRKPAAA